MTPVPNFNKWCAVFNFLFKNIDFYIFTPKTPLVKENYFLTLWNFTYLKDTSFGKKLCNFELGLETKNEFEKWPLYNFVSVYLTNSMSTQVFPNFLTGHLVLHWKYFVRLRLLFA